MRNSYFLQSSLLKLVSFLIIIFVLLMEIYLNMNPSLQNGWWRFLSVYCERIYFGLKVFAPMTILVIVVEDLGKILRMVRHKEDHSIAEVIDAFNKMIIQSLMLAITPLVLWGLGFDNPQANWHYILFMIIAVGIFYFKPIGRITFLLVSLYIILFNRYSWFNGVLYFSESDMVILLVLIVLNAYLFSPSVSRLFKNLN